MSDDPPVKAGSAVANDLSAFWMPFTPNRQFRLAPRLIDGASGMYYTTPDGRRVLDATAGLWCVNAGHCRPSLSPRRRWRSGSLRVTGWQRPATNSKQKLCDKLTKHEVFSLAFLPSSLIGCRQYCGIIKKIATSWDVRGVFYLPPKH